MKQTLRLSVVAVLAIFGLSALAQNQEGQVLVSQFSAWQLQGQQPLASGSNTVVPFGACLGSAGKYNFAELSASAPVKIVDPANPSIDEVVTPTNVVIAAQNCTATLAPSNAHPLPYYLVSGSAGLQEAVNATSLSGAQNTAVLTKDFWRTATSAIVAAATANANLALVDVSQAPYVNYHDVAGVYTAYGNVGGAVPTAAAGAAAGTSPTIANTGNGNSFTVALSSGTATTTGTLFTETWATSGSFTYAPQVTVKSVGANAPPAFTFAVTYTSSHAVLTVSVTAAPPVSTAYSFQVAAN